MSVAEERVARSVALEKAYVHDVYEQFSDGPRGKPWPKVNQFLADLEPGSLVCDVGCGNGKYLNTNPAVFNIGSDKCMRLTKVAREKENEVLVCDNLALPFRDESFDAVLSVAVVHHFATTERRVCALRELARILRIGGRLIISVWAMEQTHRKFESQDVLVPWHRPQTLSTPSLELTSTTNTSEEDVLPPYHAYTQTSDSDSNKSIRTKSGLRKRGRTRHKGRSIDPGRSSSPSSSSLSSPNETCYSFVRRAIQKLAGGKRSGNSHRPWFLETWNSCTKEPSQKRYDPDGCENYDGNIQDLPIELRRVDDDEMPQRRQTFPSSQISIGNEFGGIKSKSLTDIKTFEDRLIVRSQSSVPSLQNEASFEEPPVPVEVIRTKPKLVKQKQSICDEDLEEALDKPTDMRNLVNALPEFHIQNGVSKRGSVCKQRSMNEELMSTERLREKERVKRNIQKQASLNEDLIYQRNTLRDSFFSVSTSKRFQLIKSGFTNTIKNSTTNIEKVAGSSLKNGFVRMFQGWKANEIIVSPTQPEEITVLTVKPVINTEEKKDGERRHSKEDGSDSSKDSSLQSDTSVDSEDSFASVIFVPKADPLSPTPLSPGPTSPRLKQTSVPNSPRMKNASCPTSPRIKQMPLTVYPLTKQLSSPKPSTNSPNTPLTPTSTANIKITLSLPSRVELKLMRDQVESEAKDTNTIVTSPKIITPTIIKPVDLTIQRSLEIKENSMKLKKSPLDLTEKLVGLKGKSMDVTEKLELSFDFTDKLLEFKEQPLNFTETLVEFEPMEVTEKLVELKENSMKFKGKSMEFKANPFDITDKLVEFTDKSLDLNENPFRSKDKEETLVDVTEKPVEVEEKLIPCKENQMKSKELEFPEQLVESKAKLVAIRRNPFECIEELVDFTETPSELKQKLLATKVNPFKAIDMLVELPEKIVEVTETPLEHKEQQVELKEIKLKEIPAKPKENIVKPKETEIKSNTLKFKGTLKLKENQLTVNKNESLAQKYSVVRIPKFRKYNESITLKHRSEHNGESRTEDKKRTERLRQIRELLNNRPGFGIRSSRSAFPIVRHSSVRSGGRIEAIARPLPRLLSLELFNPETDDKDSDSSGVSSPDSVDSVINIEVTDNNSQGTKSEEETPQSRKPSPTKFAFPPIAETSPTIPETLIVPEEDTKPKLSPTSMSLLEAAADVANSLDNAVEVVMKSSPRTKRRNKEVQKISRQSSTTDSSVIEATWDEECHKHLTDFADKLSEKLLLEIDQYQEQSRKVEAERFNSEFGHIDDPYIHRLSEELKDLNKLSAEIQKQNQYLSQLSKNDLALTKQLELELNLTDLKVECKKCRYKQCKCERIHEFSDTNSDKVFVKPTIAEPSDNFDSAPKEESSTKTFHRLSRESSDASAPGEASRSSLLLQHSIESTDTADLSEMTTASGSDSQKDTNSVSRYSDCGSTASLGSNPEWSKLKPKLPNGLSNRSASQDKPQSDDSSINDQMLAGNCGSLNASLSDTSQDSLPSDNIGGSITYHRYYHVFREGELDQLIERYVENLHIISSYYDHASWCVVAEKVQVWTI